MGNRTVGIRTVDNQKYGDSPAPFLLAGSCRVGHAHHLTRHENCGGHGPPYRYNSLPRRPAFSMTEMVFAIFILGLGLLFTSSMFPIAWTKARDIFEASNTESCARAGENMFRRVAKVNGRDDVILPNPPPADPELPVSSFFPVDWFPIDIGIGVANGIVPYVYPNTRVHAMNLGSYLATPAFQEQELDDLEGPGSRMLVGDNPWRLSGQLAGTLAAQPLAFQNLVEPDQGEDHLYYVRARAHERLFPPMLERSTGVGPLFDAKRALWDEQFSGRRYCWSVLYRFSNMYGPDPDEAYVAPPIQNNITSDQIGLSLRNPRRVTVYYVTLKRPANARYARQEGILGKNGSSAGWDSNVPLNQPRALEPGMDVLLPTPWRIEASLMSVPEYGDDPTGIPSEVSVNDVVLASMLAPKTVLIDDRNGQVYRITQRREVPNDLNRVVLALDKEYVFRDIYRPRYEVFPPPSNAELENNWLWEWEWKKLGCDDRDLADLSEDNVPECRALSVFNDDEMKAKRYYWVFPPPVEAVRAGGGVPVFAGSPPVVDIETRQVVLRPK